jgi:hypothetical protein
VWCSLDDAWPLRSRTNANPKAETRGINQFNEVQFNEVQFNEVQFNEVQFNEVQFISSLVMTPCGRASLDRPISRYRDGRPQGVQNGRA